MSIWWLESGTEGSLDLLCQLPGLTVAFHPQSALYHQRVLPSRVLQPTLIPEGVRALFREGLPVKTCKVWLCQFRAHIIHTTTTPYKGRNLRLSIPWTLLPRETLAQEIQCEAHKLVRLF